MFILLSFSLLEEEPQPVINVEAEDLSNMTGKDLRKLVCQVVNPGEFTLFCLFSLKISACIGIRCNWRYAD
jgi:hypothetical protein